MAHSIIPKVSSAAYLGDPAGPYGQHGRDGFTAVGGSSIQPLFPGAFDAAVHAAMVPSFPDDDFAASVPDLFHVDNGSHVPSLRDQSSWTPLPVASLRAVDVPGPSSSDVFSSDPSVADVFAADVVRNPTSLLLLPPLLIEQLSIVVTVWLCDSIRLFYGPVSFPAVLMEASCGGQLQIVVARVVVGILLYAGRLLFFRQLLGLAGPTTVALTLFASTVALHTGIRSVISASEYNSMFAFTSLGVHVDRTVNVGNGPYVFKICGVVCHEIGSLLPPEGNSVPKFAQLYIYDTQNELDHRMGIFSQDDEIDDDTATGVRSASAAQSSSVVGQRRRREELSGDGFDRSSTRPARRQRRRREEPDPAIVQSLTTMLNGCNSLVQTFRMAKDRMFSPDAPEVAVRLYGHEGAEHGNRYSLPTAPELAALIVDDLTVEACRFDIIVQKEAGYLQRISPLNPSLMALQYPLLFPHATIGFHLGIGLSYHFWNQSTLRSETYQGISDALGEGNSSGKNVRVQYLLHSSFTGGPRYMIQNYQDGMAICRVFEAPDLFITFTCNPKWDEITEALLMEPGQRHVDRLDIVTRVFKMKINEFSGDVRRGEAFGEVHAYLYVVEFQKRGLPHIHSLVWLDADMDDPTPSTIDSFISAEIPDYATDPLGYALVEEFMVHGPCGEHNPNSPCMKDGVCSKRYPKEFNEETTIDGHGFPVYRRSKNDRYIVKNGVRLDNRWIVPYNMSLLKKFQAHINVEWCNKTKLLKYLFKYLAKGHDMARARFHSMYQSTGSESIGRNEIDEYVKCRYLSACEACWRMFAFDIHVRAPSVERLVVHLENMNRIIYSQDDNLADVVRNPSKYKTMLTEWFVANQRYTDARELTYLQFPSKWRWDTSSKRWRRRRRQLKFGPPIGRVYNVHPSCGELFYLRMLLTVVAGATSFDDLKVYHGRLHTSFKAACQARGLVGDDNEWFLLFDEAVQWASSYQLRHLFMTVLLFCGVTDGQRLLDKYWRFMADDIAFQIARSLNDTVQAIPSEYLHIQLLHELSVMFGKNGYSLSSFGISTESIRTGRLLGNRLILEELQYDRNELREMASSFHGRYRFLAESVDFLFLLALCYVI
ncbi:hypothetical protein ACQ4PT_010818 [Festuca glaucescens]